MDEEKVTAVYLMVRSSELEPADMGGYERPLEAQKKECLAFLGSRGEAAQKAVVYTSRRDLFRDIERGRIARLVVHDVNRLGSGDEIDGILFELRMAGVELITVK